MQKGLHHILRTVHRTHKRCVDGALASNLPALTRVDPDLFGICIITTDGGVYEVGDTRTSFTMQSIAKPFVYGLALEDRGVACVREHVGVEPTGGSFDSILRHEEMSERRFNPMVNAGAIVTTSLIEGATVHERAARLRWMLRRYAGQDVSIDEEVLAAKRDRDDVSRSIAYMMRSEGLIDGHIDDVLELYFQQCAMRADCRTLAAMAATLANGGRQPITGERAIAGKHVRHLLSVMFSSGLYDFSGQWAYRVGLPAKSGLAGAIIAVCPGQLGLAVYSPRLGPHAKSVRGVRSCEDISRALGLHVFESGRPRSTVIPPPREPAFQAALARVHATYQPLDAGQIHASESGPFRNGRERFGICAVSVTGEVTAVGDGDVPFLLQSLSKVFTYGLALEDHGRDAVLARVDIEPTGQAYDSIIRVDERSKRPYNPMVNTGGIAIASLIEGTSAAQRLTRVLEVYARYAGHEVFVDTPAFLAEQASNDRNRAISHLLNHFGMIDSEIDQALDLYLQQCSVRVTTRDLAVMGATLANNGINPITGVQAIASQYVTDMLTVMYTCGMYDAAGEWAFNVGFPAKSGVGGGLMVVVPGCMGIALFSPPLDAHGNSIRGVRACNDLFGELRLHGFAPPAVSARVRLSA